MKLEHSKDTVVVNKELADKIETLRFEDDAKNGFQRPLETARVKRMSQELSNGGSGSCPAIIVGDLRNRLILLDGQHRLEAWKLSFYPLEAKIVKLDDMNHARRVFVDLNSKQKRMTLALRLAVDPGEYALRLRKLSEKFNMSVTDANLAMQGVHGEARIVAPINDEWLMLELMVEHWSKDKRWDKSTNIYSRGFVLRAAFAVAKGSKDIAAALNDIRTMDFSMGGKMSRHSNSTHKQLKTLIYDHIAKRVLA